MVVLGERIKEFRQRNGRTQDALASELGVTAQAVSRWEKGICCPDIELIPPIANYFGVSIDELFGYDNERSKRVDVLYEKICDMNRRNNGVDIDLDNCIACARAALIEFPGNAKLGLALASVLFNAGYVRRGEFHIIDEDGYGLYDAERHKRYPEWQEAIKIYEKILPELPEGAIRQEAVTKLSQLYKNTGEHEKAPLIEHVQVSTKNADHCFAPELPELWPWWDVPERDRIKREMQADPRWNEWVRETR